MNADKFYAHQPEKRSFCTLNFCMIAAHFYIHTCCFQGKLTSQLPSIKVLLKCKLSAEPSYVQDSVSL